MDRNWLTPNCLAVSRVAPLAGSVDRNLYPSAAATSLAQSLPSRGAWIEIGEALVIPMLREVAPLAGSVDRNITLTYDEESLPRRSPRGERG